MESKKSKMKQLAEIEIEFLKESNAIEGEYSEQALEDAKEAWDYATWIVNVSSSLPAITKNYILAIAL